MTQSLWLRVWAFRFSDTVLGRCYGSLWAKNEFRLIRRPPPPPKKDSLGLLAWLAFEGVISKQTLSHPLTHAVETSKTWVSAVRAPSAPVPRYQQGVPVCSLPALGQAAQPRGAGPLGMLSGLSFAIISLDWSCGSPSRDQARVPGWEEACLLPLTCVGRLDPAESP